MRDLLIIAMACMLVGCADFNRQEQTATTRTVERVGIEQGQPTQITETTTERTASESQAQAGVDVGKAITSAMAALRGDLITAIQAMKPADPPKPSGIDLTSGAVGTAVGVGMLALRELMARKQAQQIADAHAREVELARQLPPPTTEKG